MSRKSLGGWPADFVPPRDTRRAVEALVKALRPASRHARVVIREATTHGVPCATVNPEWFFPDWSDPDKSHAIDAAKRLCSGCPVRRSCLEWALDINEKRGVWGGLTTRERATLRSQRAAS